VANNMGTEAEGTASAQAQAQDRIRTLDHRYTYVEPGPKKMRQIMVFVTTCERWITIVDSCKTRRINLLGGVANVLLGVFLAALGPAISDIASQTKFSLTPWVVIAMLSLLGAVISGAAYWQIGTYEQGTLTSLSGELHEHKDRYDDQPSS
jgi:hypothetical protein